MKKLIALSILGSVLLFANAANAQSDKSKRASPPAKVALTINTGATVIIDYSQPSVKGRTIGTDLEPKKDEVWRMGANEATVFEVDKNVKINGKKLPAGKYSLFGLQGENDFTIIFNKEWKIWGTTYDANKDKDVLKVAVPIKTNDKMQEQLTYTIDKKGNVKLLWGKLIIAFQVQ